MPSDGLFDEGEFLGMAEVDIVSRYLSAEHPHSLDINAVFASTEKQFEDQDRILKLREQIISDFNGTVFRDKVYPNPGPRGRYGVAYIPLKRDAIPKWARPYPMQGEKAEAYKKLSMTGFHKN